jgi:hypothetical protein
MSHICRGSHYGNCCTMCGRHLTHRALQAAFDKGYASLTDGSTCPYDDKRGGKYDHITTFSRAYINAWHAGRKYAEVERTERQGNEHCGV